MQLPCPQSEDGGQLGNGQRVRGSQRSWGKDLRIIALTLRIPSKVLRQRMNYLLKDLFFCSEEQGQKQVPLTNTC